MKMLSHEQIRACDAFTIENEAVSSLHLMENAAHGCYDFIVHEFNKNETIYIFCGVGNNGGDGFALARLLYRKGFYVEVFIDKGSKITSKDALANLNNLKDLGGVLVADFSDWDPQGVSTSSVIVDALFGSGLNRKIEGKYREIIEKINAVEANKIAIDIPSGLFADGNGFEDAVVFQADVTLSFQFYKKAFLHEETGRYCGKIVILDIGLSKEFTENIETDNLVITEDCIRKIYRPRYAFAHKGNYGKACIVGGSFGKMGAAVLAAKAALRAGAGITYTIAPRCGYEILQTASPEAMFRMGGIEEIQNFDVEEDYRMGIGPGMGTSKETSGAFLDFLVRYKKPLILDADALNIMAAEKDACSLIPANSILTPHPVEFTRLFGTANSSYEMLDMAKQKAQELNCCIVLKGHYTQVVTPGQTVYYNVTGNAGMAKGGSGDVLLGVITALLAQQYTPEEAAIMGVWIHGRAGDLAAEKYSKEAMLATDIIDHLGEVFHDLDDKKRKF